MEEYQLFLERHPGYNDDGILLGDEIWKVIVNMMKSLNQTENDRIVIITPLEIIQMWEADFLIAFNK